MRRKKKRESDSTEPKYPRTIEMRCGHTDCGSEDVKDAGPTGPEVVLGPTKPKSTRRKILCKQCKRISILTLE